MRFFLESIGHGEEVPGYGEIRFLAPGKPPIVHFFTSVNKINWAEVERRNRQGYSVYVGVGRRHRKAGNKSDVSQVGSLWGDLDGKDFDRDDPEHGKQRALDHLRAALPAHLQPSFIVDSGYGLHLYWVLKEPWTFDDESDVRRFEAVLRGLAAQLHGDRAVAEIARVMRLPGTLNQKRDKPVECRVLEHHPDRTFHLEDFIDYEDVVPQVQAKQQAPTGQPTEKKLSRATLEFLAIGAVDGERNSRLFAAACDMAGCGWPQADAEQRLVDSAMHSGLPDAEARRTVHSAFSRDRSAARPDSAPRRDFEVLIGELDSLKDSAPSVIQDRAWQWVEDAARWSEADIGRFSDRLCQAGLTRSWAKSWLKAVKNSQQSANRERMALSSLPDVQDGDDPENSLPAINVTDRRLRDTSADTLLALAKSNDPPTIFVRGNGLVDILVDERQQAGIRNIDVPALRGKAERVANFVKERPFHGKKIAVPVPPPEIVVNDILSLGKWTAFPPLHGIVTAPIVAPDGSLELQPGYLPRAQVYYHSETPIDIGDTTPTDANVKGALHLLTRELLGDFPFADQASRAHTLALMFTPFVRPLIKGQTPHMHVGSPIEGSEKTLLADVCIMVFDPTGARILTIANFAEEMRKRITSVLSTGPSHVLIDNLSGMVDSAEVAAAITAPVWYDRLLGQTHMLNLPVRCIWLSTGNNVRFSNELARRTVNIRLDARVEQPWERQGFRHPVLREWARENRGRLVTACLTLIRCWLEMGRPLADPRLGGFESWSQVMGGILGAVGVEGFLSNLSADYRHFATDKPVFGAFVQAWHAQYQDKAVGVSELFPIASSLEVTGEDGNPVIKGQELLASELGDGNERSRRIRLGKLLGDKTNRVYGSLRIVLDGTASNAAQYRLENVNGHSA